MHTINKQYKHTIKSINIQKNTTNTINTRMFTHIHVKVSDDLCWVSVAKYHLTNFMMRNIQVTIYAEISHVVSYVLNKTTIQRNFSVLNI